jgi:anaphase-promoting complex subunit 5
VWDLLLNKLWKINSFDALHVFFDTLSLLLQRTQEQLQNEPEDGLEIDSNLNRMLLSRTSPLGAFVRRAQLEFTRLQFHDGLTLWKSFVVYRAPTLPQWKKRNQTAGNTSFDINLQQEHLGIADRLTEAVYGELGSEASQEVSISTVDVEKLLEYQVDQMQSMQKG